jgi:hypothetical protein
MSDSLNGASTLLVFTPNVLPPYASRSLHQALTVIAASKNFRRTVNGTLVSLAPSQFHKYASTITCDDMDSPGLDGVFPGAVFTVDCAEELSYLTQGGTPDRPVVPGSSRTDGIFTFYRPVLTMEVIDFKLTLDEWQRVVGWQMDLEEQ